MANFSLSTFRNHATDGFYTYLDSQWPPDLTNFTNYEDLPTNYTHLYSTTSYSTSTEAIDSICQDYYDEEVAPNMTGEAPDDFDDPANTDDLMADADPN
jgi:hypothetical protein